MSASGQNVTQTPQRVHAAALLESPGHVGGTLLPWQKHGSPIQKQETLKSERGRIGTQTPQRVHCAALLECR